MKSDRRLLALATPFVAGIILIVVGPALGTFVLAFFEYDLIQSPRWIGLAGFRALLADDIFRIALKNTIIFTTIAVPLRLVGAMALGLMFHGPGRGNGRYRTAILLPTFLPEVSYAIAWLWIANPLFGPLNLLLETAGAPTPRWFTDPAAAQTLVILMSLFTIGEGFVVTIAVRNQIPSEYYELASVSGVGRVAAFRRITLPLMSPALLMLAMRDSAFAFQATFVAALIVTDGGPPPFSTTYLPTLAYQNSFEYLRYGYGAAITVVMLIFTILILLAQRGLVRRTTLLWA